MLSTKQARSLGTSSGRVNLWVGAIRSGKTYVSLLRFLMAVAKAPHGGEIVIVGKNRDSIYRNVFRVIEEAAGLRAFRGVVKYRQGAPTAVILGREVHVIGANDAKAENKIRGMTVLLGYVDELTVIPQEFFKQLLGRMSPPGAQLFATTNPDSDRHWLKVDYLDRLHELRSWVVYHFTMDDNPSLEDAYKTALKAEYSGVWYDRFILGLWGAAEGAIFDTFNGRPYADGGHVLPWADVPRLEQFFTVGIDQGSTNPTSAIAVGVGIVDGVRRLIAVDEWRYDGSGKQARMTNIEQARAITDWVRAGKHAPRDLDRAPKTIYADPAAADFREEMRRLRSTTYPANNDVTPGLQLVSSLFATRRLLIADRCGGLLGELPSYRWDPDETAKGRDKPIKTDDHSVDALRYAVASSEHKWSKFVLPKEDRYAA